MPFAVPDFVAAIAAAAAYLLAIGGAAVVGWLAGRIPDPSFLGFHPLGFVQDVLKAIEHYFIDLETQAGTVLHDLIAASTYIVSKSLQAVLAVLGVHADQLDHVSSVTVPRALADANRHADSAVAGEADRARGAERQNADAAGAAGSAAAAVGALLGHVIHGTMAADVQDAQAFAVHQADSYTDQQDQQIGAALTSSLGGVWGAITPLQQAVSVTIPQEFAAEAAASQAYADSVGAAARKQLADTSAALSQELAQTRSDLGTSIANASQAQSALSQADLTTAEGQAQADAAQATIAAESVAQANLSATAADLDQRIGATNKALADATATTTIALPALPDVSIPNSITIPIAVGALAGAVAGILEEVDSCMISDCGSGPNQLGNALQRLLGGLTTLGELGFLAEAVKNPVGTADAIQPLMAAVDSGAMDLWDAILGIA